MDRATEIDKIQYAYHPIQNYYSGELIGKVQEPIETDHILTWVSFKELQSNMKLEMQKMQKWAIDECMKQYREN